MLVSLQVELDVIKLGISKHAPATALDTMKRATDDLRVSGILDHVIKVGHKIPAFELPNSVGDMVSSAAVNGVGPLILTIFRGHW